MKAHHLLIITLCGLVVCNLFAYTSALEKRTEHWIEGSITPEDHLLKIEIVEVPYKVLRSVMERRNFTSNNHEKIQAFQILNNKDNGYPSEYTLDAGGIRYDFMNVTFKSQSGHGIHAVVLMWGH